MRVRGIELNDFRYSIFEIVLVEKIGNSDTKYTSTLQDRFPYVLSDGLNREWIDDRRQNSSYLFGLLFRIICVKLRRLRRVFEESCGRKEKRNQINFRCGSKGVFSVLSSLFRSARGIYLGSIFYTIRAEWSYNWF